MNIKFEILPPTMPNYVRYKQKPRLKQDGFKTDNGFPITDFTREEAMEYGELMKQEFIKHWEIKMTQKSLDIK